jgi:glutamate carboxypeptidase
MPLSELEQRLSQRIARRSDEMLDDLAKHVAIPTGLNFTPGLDEYRELLLGRLRRLGASIEMIPGDPRPQWLDFPGAAVGDASVPPVAVARKHDLPGAPRMLIAGHLDTVHDPKGAFRELSIAPDRRTCIGPGAVDMKGGILIAIVALEALSEAGVRINWTFLLNGDEETGSFHSYRTLFDAATRHDFGLALEPAMPDGGLVVSRMGSGQFKIEAFGRSAHVGRDFTKGVSAVTALAQTILKLAGLAQPERGAIVNVGPLQGGSVTNAVPEYAACWGNVRFADANIARTLGEQFDALAHAEGLPRVAVHRAFNRPAKPETSAVLALARTARQVATDLGQELPFGATGGVCDGNILQEAGLATIDTLGVRGGNLHRTDEFVEISSLAERCSLLAILLMRLGSTGAIAPI